MNSLSDLDVLRVDLSSMETVTAYEWGERYYLKHLVRGFTRSSPCLTHDSEIVKFFDDRYFHGFRTSKDRARRAYAKDKVAVDRIERIQWIRPILEGQVEGRVLGSAFENSRRRLPLLSW